MAYKQVNLGSTVVSYFPGFLVPHITPNPSSFYESTLQASTLQMPMTPARTLLARGLQCELKAHLRQPTLLTTQGLGEHPLFGANFHIV